MNYYKVKPDSQTQLKLTALISEMNYCNQKAFELKREVGADSAFRSNLDKAGGIYTFVFRKGFAPESWIKKEGGRFPDRKLKAHAEILERIDNLPKVSIIDWANIFGCDICHQPGCFKFEETYYINSKEALGEDFTQIKQSEWAQAKELKFESQS